MGKLYAPPLTSLVQTNIVGILYSLSNVNSYGISCRFIVNVLINKDKMNRTFYFLLDFIKRLCFCHKIKGVAGATAPQYVRIYT